MAGTEDIIVSVIIPARNEEACVALCLESLVTQTAISFEIILVDDASTDRTGDIARSFADAAAADGHTRPSDLQNVTLISAPPLPESWTGKNNAMSAGANIAKGKWLLFTDADTVHKSGSLARAVAEAEEHGVALLSYSPEQELRTFWEKAVMPVIFAELAATYPPARVRDPNSSIAAANGQYLMISREAYDAVGGHTKIASDLLEDVAMARLVKSSGRKIWFRYGGDAVRTRMYRTWPQMKEGWTKNLALLFPKPAELAWRRVGEFLALVLVPICTALSYWASSVHKLRFFRWYYVFVGALLAFALLWTAVEYIIRLRRARSGWQSILLSVLGLPVFAYLLLRSRRAYNNGRFDWKDRSYVYGADEVKNMAASSGVESSRPRRV